jgi:hypothetical protein
MNRHGFKPDVGKVLKGIRAAEQKTTCLKMLRMVMMVMMMMMMIMLMMMFPPQHKVNCNASAE